GSKNRIPRLQKGATTTPGPDARGLYPGSAILHRMGAVARRCNSPGDAACDGARRSASNSEISSDWAAFQYAGIRSSVFLQTGFCHGKTAGRSLRGMVNDS